MLKVFLIIIVLCVSFYAINKLSFYIIKRSDLYKEIDKVKDEYEIKEVDAFIEERYIIPGLEGMKVNVLNSYYKMRAFFKFDEYYLDYDIVKPNVSIENNKDKIITRGNGLKNGVSFIILNNDSVTSYFTTNNIKVDLLVNLYKYDKSLNVEFINYEYDDYKKMDDLLSKDKNNYNLCYANLKFRSLCMKMGKYLVKTEKEIDGSSIVDIEKNIESGDIYLVLESAKVQDVDYLVKKIKYKGLNIIYLSELISEQRR